MGSLDEGVEERGFIPTVIDVPEVFFPHIEVTLLCYLGVTRNRLILCREMERKISFVFNGVFEGFSAPFSCHLRNL